MAAHTVRSTDETVEDQIAIALEEARSIVYLLEAVVSTAEIPQAVRSAADYSLPRLVAALDRTGDLVDRLIREHEADQLGPVEEARL
jgi:hypothetical protein